jgi:hypothetical protein
MIKGDWNAEILSPSTEVEKMWHQHILDVVNYSHECMLLCGHVIGHNPDGGLIDSAPAERGEATRAAFEEHFGEKAGDEILPTIVESTINAPALSSAEVIAVRMRSQGGVSFFRIRSGRRLEILFQEYARLKKVNRDDFRFVFHGEQLLGDETAEMLELISKDVINCLLVQGGCLTCFLDSVPYERGTVGRRELHRCRRTRLCLHIITTYSVR